MFNKRKENLFLWESILDIDFLPFVYIHFLSQLILLDCFEQILCGKIGILNPFSPVHTLLGI